MMRKVGLRAPARLYPAIIGRPSTSILRAKRPQPGRFSTAAGIGLPTTNRPGGVRHSRAPSREAALQKSRRKRLNREQAGPRLRLPLKCASTPGNFRKAAHPCPATFGMAPALVTNTVPWGMQTAACLQIRRQLISFSALSNPGCAADMWTPVTTSERVGRTMEAKAPRPRSNRNDEQWSESRICEDLPIPCRGSRGSRRTPRWRGPPSCRSAFASREHLDLLR